MSKTASLALAVFGIAVGVLGAILRFAVEDSGTGFDSQQAGIILLVAGIFLAVVALLMAVAFSRTRKTPENPS
jgi:hypothetical protein